uniref:Uncharacterized protein n=1 Tax=Arundo donax TaxID=35708 RepID=A0A0A9CHQ2_ARUDO
MEYSYKASVIFDIDILTAPEEDTTLVSIHWQMECYLTACPVGQVIS